MFHVLKQLGCIFGADNNFIGMNGNEIWKKRRGDRSRPELDVFTTE